MSDFIIDGTNIDTSVFAYSNPKAHASGGKVVNLFHRSSKESITIATPLILTWGAQEGLEQGTKRPTGKFTMSLQFPSTDYSTPDLESFLTSMRALENQVKQDAMKHSKEWFGKEIKSAEVIDEKFNVMLKHPKKEKGGVEMDLNKPPTLTVKVPQWSGVWKSEIYDEDGEPVFIHGKTNPAMTPLDFLKPKSHVICLIQCGGLWFINGKVSITWNLKQAMVQKPKPSMEGTCFLVPKLADKEKMKTLPQPDASESFHPAEDFAQSAIVVDSDDEGDGDAFVVPVPVPTQIQQEIVEEVTAELVATEEVKPKKKIVRKKTVAGDTDV